MTGQSSIAPSYRAADVLTVTARWIVAVVFVYMGITKALHPVEFLKLVRQYGLIDQPVVLNLVAALVPWLEVFCGLLLLAGVAVRGTAALVAAMLVAFSMIILLRALELREVGGLALCVIKFDCGCGGGEILVCRKLGENLVLTLLSFWVVVSPRQRFCLRPFAVTWPAPRAQP